MTTTSFLRGAKCRLGACDEVGEGNQERRVVSNSRQTPDCRVMRSSLIHGDPGFNWGSGSSKGRCIRRVWGARMGPEGLKNSALKYIAPKEEKKERSPQVPGFFWCSWLSVQVDLQKIWYQPRLCFLWWEKTHPGPRSCFFWNPVKLKQPTHHRQVLTACSNSSQPSRGVLFQPILVTWRFDDFDRVKRSFNRVSCLDSTNQLRDATSTEGLNLPNFINWFPTTNSSTPRS